MQTVFVGLSGGVDSAVSAALLKEQGYDVVGAFIKIWRPEFIECPWQKERLDAMRICAHLGIPFKEIDLSDEYKKEVVDDLVSGYAKGITPNPDILCNRHIKFGAFKKWAHTEGADLIATGHYARLEGGKLLRGMDTNKDQSYFLARLSKKELDGVLFPVGTLPKSEVRARAAAFGLPVAAKKDSQGLCFVGEVSMREFLGRYLPLEKGKVVDEAGKAVGEHDGAALYTPGERHGFRVFSRSASETPHYVIRIDIATNRIVISPQKGKAARSAVPLYGPRWIGEAPAFPFRTRLQARYREAAVPCTVLGSDTGLEAVFDEPHLAPPGQTMAFYDGDELLGSAIAG